MVALAGTTAQVTMHSNKDYFFVTACLIIKFPNLHRLMAKVTLRNHLPFAGVVKMCFL